MKALKVATVTLKLTRRRLARLREVGRMLAEIDAKPWPPERILARLLDAPARDGICMWAINHDPRPLAVLARMRREWREESKRRTA